MDCRGLCFDQYFRNVPPRRLMIYGIIVISLLVTTILLIIPSSENEEPQPTPEPSGRDILRVVPLVDGYNALPVELMDRLRGVVSTFPFNKNTSSEEETSWCRSDLPKFQTGLVSTQIFTVKPSCSSQFKDAVSKTLQQIDALSRLIAMYPNDTRKITHFGDISTTKEQGKFGIIIGLDGGHAIDNKLASLRVYYDLGVRCLTLNSECSTTWSTSYLEKDTDDKAVSLSEFGKKVIKEMNRIGMIIDLSRSSKRTQLAVLDATEAPVIFTAIAAYNVSPVKGNLEDEVLERLKKNDGLVMVTFDTRVLSDDKNASAVVMRNVVNNINYVRQTVGIDNIGIAAGFHRNSSVPVRSLSDSSKYPALFERLKKSQKGEPSWSSDDLKKLAGLNFIRVWERVEQVKNSLADEIPNEALADSQEVPLNKRFCSSEPFSR